jgi:hypothetical protein
MKVLIIILTVLSTISLSIGFSENMPSKSTAIQNNNQEIYHSGRTDKSGCHNDHKNGGRHCH